MSMHQNLSVELNSLDVLWLQVGGTICNLACRHCFISCSPTNRTHNFISFKYLSPFIREAVALGVKEYYVTGGEPFLNPEIFDILEMIVQCGPATVLTNGLLLDRDRCQRLRQLSEATDYSLDLRISLDGHDPRSNDPIRGEGTFNRIVEGAVTATRLGLNPVITVTEVNEENATESGRSDLIACLRKHGISHPRLKFLPVFKIGAEAKRSGAYEYWQNLQSEQLENNWDHLQCNSCRIVTDLGVWVCPILVNEPAGRMGGLLTESLIGYPATHSACWTCHMAGVSCRT